MVVWRDEEADAADHVQAHAGVRVLVDVGNDGLDVLELEEKVDRVSLAVVGEQERDQAVAEGEEGLGRLASSLTVKVLLSELGSEVAAGRAEESESVSAPVRWDCHSCGGGGAQLTERIHDPTVPGPPRSHL